MKFMTFSILALSTMAAAVQAEQQLAQQPTPELFVASAVSYTHLTLPTMRLV